MPVGSFSSTFLQSCFDALSSIMRGFQRTRAQQKEFVLESFSIHAKQGSGFVQTTKDIKILLSGNFGMSSTKFLDKPLTKHLKSYLQKQIPAILLYHI